MMKQVLAAALLLWSGSVAAQSGMAPMTTPGTAPGYPTATGTFAGGYGITPQPLGNWLGQDVTPQTRRDRIARAQMVAEADPALVAKLSGKQLAGYERTAAMRAYQRAEKKARWARIDARE